MEEFGRELDLPSEATMQRTLGWLVLRGQEHRLWGERARFQVLAPGVVISWTGGPSAADTALALSRDPDPDLPVEELDLDEWTENRATVRVGGVWVQMLSRMFLGQEWNWPDPLHTDGVALDCVLWTPAAAGGGDVDAVVLRLPVAAARADAARFREPGVFVAHVDHAPDSATARLRAMTQLATIQVRSAPRGWTLTDADQWLDTEIARCQYGPTVHAVLFDQRCLMRVTSGLRVDAVSRGSYPPGRSTASLVPAVVLEAMSRTSTATTPPPALRVRHFGGYHHIGVFDVETSLAVPSTTRP